MSKREGMAAANIEQRKILCENLSFAASEAYKLLRANLSFAISKVDKCPVVAITSSIRGEAKTTTSINLSYTVAQTGKKVLIIDGDMRLPNVARTLVLDKAPGLSDVLAGKATVAESIKPTGIIDKWDILPAGNIPPNPSELLDSPAASKLIEGLRDKYDFIVIDMPPVGIVSDALVVAPIVDGLIVVARQDYTPKKLFRSCVNSLEPVKQKILGVVVTDTNKNIKGYKYGKNKYRYYSKRYESTKAYGSSRTQTVSRKKDS